jgi:uncharacterized caspase-like protein
MAAATTCVNLVLLDACRNNPLADRVGTGKGKGSASEATAGFSFSGDRNAKPRETYIVFSTASNDVASDGYKNSPFMNALLKNIYAPGLDFQLMIRRVRHDVANATDQRQRPEEYGDITRSIIMLPKVADSNGPPVGGPLVRSFEVK